MQLGELVNVRSLVSKPDHIDPVQNGVSYVVLPVTSMEFA